MDRTNNGNAADPGKEPEPDATGAKDDANGDGKPAGLLKQHPAALRGSAADQDMLRPEGTGA